MQRREPAKLGEESVSYQRIENRVLSILSFHEVDAEVDKSWMSAKRMDKQSSKEGSGGKLC
jgi:hypothetical protein